MVELDLVAEFREDHRRVRDTLLEMIDALNSRDVGRAKEVLGRLDALIGPHFRFELEALYPALRVFLIEYVAQVFNYVDRLVKEREGIIETLRSCAELLEKEKLGDEEAKQAAEAARELLIHVSNCDRLAMLTGELRSDTREQLAEELVATRDSGVRLLEWVERIRDKQEGRSDLSEAISANRPFMSRSMRMGLWTERDGRS